MTATHDEVVHAPVAHTEGHHTSKVEWVIENVGFGFECLTRSEARYLENSADAQTIRDRLVAAGFAGGA